MTGKEILHKMKVFVFPHVLSWLSYVFVSVFFFGSLTPIDLLLLGFPYDLFYFCYFFFFFGW